MAFCFLGERSNTDNLNRKALESGLKQALLSVFLCLEEMLWGKNAKAFANAYRLC